MTAPGGLRAASNRYCSIGIVYQLPLPSPVSEHREFQLYLTTLFLFVQTTASYLLPPPEKQGQDGDPRNYHSQQSATWR
jgi:hypothetical protein